MRETSRIVPLEEALAAVDSPSAVADRRKRAEALVDELPSYEFEKQVMLLSMDERNSISEPLRTPYANGPASGDAARLAEAVRRERATVVKQIERQLRVQAIQAVWTDPDRLEAESIWLSYCKQVNFAAFQQGNRADAFVEKFRDLIGARTGAEEHGDADEVRAIERRLERLTKIPYPRLPDAAWAVADALPAVERQAETERLEIKYGPRNATTNGGGGKSRIRREARPMQALTVR